MVYCANCGMFMDDTMRNCPRCGAPNPNYVEPEAYLEKERMKNYRDMKALAMEDEIPWDKKKEDVRIDREDFLRKLGEWFAEGYEVGHLREVLNREPAAAVKVFQDYEIRIHQLKNMEKKIRAMDFLKPDERERLTSLLKNPMKLDTLKREIAAIEDKRRQKAVDPKKIGKANQWYNIGKALMVLEKYSDALSYFERALREYPGHEEAYDGKMKCEEALAKKRAAPSQPVQPGRSEKPSAPVSAPPGVSPPFGPLPAPARIESGPHQSAPAPAPQPVAEPAPVSAYMPEGSRSPEDVLEGIRDYAKKHANKPQIPEPPKDVDEEFVEKILSASGPTLRQPEGPAPAKAVTIPETTRRQRSQEGRGHTPASKASPAPQGVRAYKGTGVPGHYRKRKAAPPGPPRPVSTQLAEHTPQRAVDVLEPVTEMPESRGRARSSQAQRPPLAAPPAYPSPERTGARPSRPHTRPRSSAVQPQAGMPAQPARTASMSAARPRPAPIPGKSPAANPGALYDKAKEALGKKKLDEALKFIDTALEALPNNPDYLSLKGEILGRKKNLNDAINYFDRALKLRPRDSAIMTLKGVALFQIGNYRASLEMCETALRIDPSNSKAMKGRAACMKKLGM